MKIYLEKAKKYFVPSVVFVISSYALYLRLVKLARHILWDDECGQLNTMLGSFVNLLKTLRYGEYCSYLSGDFYLIYPFFKIFFYNKWGLAIPHIIATIAGFYLLYLICKRYFNSMWGFIITFLILCFNFNLINHATEIRPYAVLPTLALGTFYSLSLLIGSGFTLNRKNKIIIGSFLVLVIWFHAYGILMVFSLLAFLLLSVRKEKYFGTILTKTISFMSLVLCIAMPLWIYSVVGPHLEFKQFFKQFNTDTFYFIPDPLKNLPGFLKGIFGNLLGFKKLNFLLIGLVFPFLFPYKERTKQIIFLIFAVMLPISLIFLLDLKNKYWFVQRQFVWVMPLFAFYLGWAWDSFFTLFFRPPSVKGKMQRSH